MNPDFWLPNFSCKLIRGGESVVFAAGWINSNEELTRRHKSLTHEIWLIFNESKLCKEKKNYLAEDVLIPHLWFDGCLSVRSFIILSDWIPQLAFFIPACLFDGVGVHSAVHLSIMISWSFVSQLNSYRLRVLSPSHPFVHKSCPRWCDFSFSDSLSFISLQVPECVGSAGGASRAGGEGDDHQDNLPRGSLPGPVM